MPVELWGACEFAWREIETRRILDPQQAAGWEVLQNTLQEFFRFPRLPNEIALEVGKRHFAIMNTVQKEPQLLRTGVQDATHDGSPSRSGDAVAPNSLLGRQDSLCRKHFGRAFRPSCSSR